jgi:hypothetical protein
MTHIDTTYISPQERIESAQDIEHLASILNSMTRDEINTIDLAGLPAWGSMDIDTFEREVCYTDDGPVWAWDDTHALTTGYDGNFEVVPHDDLRSD